MTTSGEAPPGTSASSEGLADPTVAQPPEAAGTAWPEAALEAAATARPEAALEAVPQSASDVDDAGLARRAANGDAAAMAALLERHFDFVHAVCRRVLADPAAAEDARQEVLFRIASNIRSFDQRSSFRTWAFVIARRVALNAIRSRDRAPVPAQGVIEAAGSQQAGSLHAGVLRAGSGSGSGSGSGVEATVAARVDVDTALRQLPAARREVVVLRYLCDLSYEEIAESLGIPLNTVRTRLRRGLADLRAILGNFPDAAGVQ